DIGEFRDGELAAGTQQQQSQTGRFGCSAQGVEYAFHRSKPSIFFDINISLYIRSTSMLPSVLLTDRGRLSEFGAASMLGKPVACEGLESMVKRLSLLVLAVAFAAAPLVSPAAAMQAATPPDMIRNLVNQAISVIQDKQETDQQRTTKFRSLLESGFDIPR